MDCLEPPLQEVPVDEWFCPECVAPGAAPAIGTALPRCGTQPSLPRGGGSGQRLAGNTSRGLLWGQLPLHSWAGLAAGHGLRRPRLGWSTARCCSESPHRSEALVGGGHTSPGFSFFQDASSVSEEEVSLLLADVVPTTSRFRPHVGRTRAIARTRQSERVRATVNRNRISSAQRIQVGAWRIQQRGVCG